MPRFVLLLLPGLALLAPGGLAGDACSQAGDALHAELDASGGSPTPGVAHALAAAFDACPQDAGTSSDEPLPPLLRRVPPWELRIDHGLLAQECGYDRLQRGHHPDAPINGIVQSPEYQDVGGDRADATVTYDPLTSTATYEAIGPQYGLFASSSPPGAPGGVGSGTVYLYGVGIPATLSAAEAGCGAARGSLCWGDATAVVRPPHPIPPLVTIMVHSSFNHC